MYRFFLNPTLNSLTPFNIPQCAFCKRVNGRKLWPCNISNRDGTRRCDPSGGERIAIGNWAVSCDDKMRG